jgi:DNA-binding GntR family transcriptional regulator
MADEGDRDESAVTGALFGAIVNRHGRQFQTVGDMVYEVIREGILTGVFAPGERLRQDRLAEAIGVSRIPVRSALMQLESDGLLTFHRYRGAVVNRLTVDEMREIYEIRALLETHALRKAMSAMTPERLAHLEALARKLNEIDDGEEFLAQRMAFYHELYDGDHQPQLIGLIDRLRASAARYWLQRQVDYIRRPGQRDHQEVLKFLRKGDVEGAVSWLQQHLDRLCEELVALMEKDSQPPLGR